MEKYWNTVTYRSGTRIEGATIEVLDSGGALTEIFSDENGSSSLGTSTTTDENGFYQFYVADGTYSVRHTFNGVSETITGIEIYDRSQMRADIDAADSDKATAAALGVAADAEDMGTFTGSTISDNVTAKVALQDIETSHEAAVTTIGVSLGDTDMGTYTGATIPDNETAKQNLQSLETAVETKANASALGVTSSASDMGTFTGSTISDSQTAKQALQALETAVEDARKVIPLSVTDYGAVGDWNGTTGTDNLTAFDDCYDAAVTLAAAGYAPVIRIPEGRYRFSDEWNIWRVNSPRRDIVIEGADELSTILTADFFGASKALIKCVDPAGTSRASPTTIRDIGFANSQTTGGNNPVFISILGHGESRLEHLRFGRTNNSVMKLYGEQNLRASTITSFFGGRNFNKKDTAGFTFSVDTTANTITASAAIFDATDVGKFFFIYPSDATRYIRYTISAYTSDTVVEYSETTGDLTQTSVSGHFEPARCSMTAASAVLTADADCFTSDDVGLVVYVQGAAAGSYGDSLLRGEIISYTAANEVTLSVAADNTVSDVFFGLAVLDMGKHPNMDGSSDVKIDKLQIESFSGVALVCQDTDSYHIVQSKLHGTVSLISDTDKALAAAWLDDHGGRFEVDLDSGASLADARIYCCNFNDTTVFDFMWSRWIINGTLIKAEEFTTADGYVILRGLHLFDNATPGPEGAISDANYVADADDPRVLFSGNVDMVSDSAKARHYVGRGAYFEPNGRFYPSKRLTDTALSATVTWNSTPPSGTETKQYRWEQIGSLVFFEIRCEYTVAGTTNSSFSVALPSDMPAPSLLTGTANNELVATNITGMMATAASGVAPNLTKTYIVGDGAGGYSLTVVLNSGTISALYASVSGFYFTA